MGRVMCKTITHFGVENTPGSVHIKEATFFREQGGETEAWGKNWEPIFDASTIGAARRKFAEKHGIHLSDIYLGEL